jgi:hypothetical protein
MNLHSFWAQLGVDMNMAHNKKDYSTLLQGYRSGIPATSVLYKLLVQVKDDFK